MALFDKMFSKDDRMTQLQGEIRSLQLRKDSVISTLSNEIQELLNEKNKVLLQAGTKAYEGWKANSTVTETLEPFWKRSKEIESMIAEKEKKREEMAARYDEEISLIQRNVYVPTAVAGKCLCPNCNAPIDEGYVFCEKCGSKIG